MNNYKRLVNFRSLKLETMDSKQINLAFHGGHNGSIGFYSSRKVIDLGNSVKMGGVRIQTYKPTMWRNSGIPPRMGQ